MEKAINEGISWEGGCNPFQWPFSWCIKFWCFASAGQSNFLKHLGGQMIRQVSRPYPQAPSCLCNLGTSRLSWIWTTLPLYSRTHILGICNGFFAHLWSPSRHLADHQGGLAKHCRGLGSNEWWTRIREHPEWIPS